MASGVIYGDTSNSLRWRIDWSSSGNSSTNVSSVTATLYIEVMKVNTTSFNNYDHTASITINGSTTTKNTVRFDVRNKPVGTKISIVSATTSVTHNSDGNKSITISGKHVTGISVGTQNVSGTVTLDTLLKPPGAPSGVSSTGRFENGMSTTTTWNAGSGTVSSYTVQRRFWKKPGDTYSAWQDVGTTSSRSYTMNHSDVRWHSQQVRVRANNAAGSSDWTTGNWIYHDGINVNSGNGFTKGKIRVWNGSSWVQAYLMVWNGSEWVTGI